MKTYKRVIVYEPLVIDHYVYDWCQNREPKMLKLFEGLVTKLMILRWRHSQLLNEIKDCESEMKKILLYAKLYLIFTRSIILFWKMSKKFKKTDYLPEELEAYTYFGVRILRLPLIHKLGIKIHVPVMTAWYEYIAIEELHQNNIFRELFALRSATLQYYYAKCAWKRTIYKKRKIPFHKTHILGRDRRWYRQESQRAIRMIRKRFPEQLKSKWFPVFIDELVYLLEFEDKYETAKVYRKMLR